MNHSEPEISYIVSAHSRPEMLLCCLASLKCQTDKRLEVIVTDNAPDPETRSAHKDLSNQFGAYYYPTNAISCYHSAELGAAAAAGKYLCFPSDDSYYVPRFGELMLAAAGTADLDLVYCEMLYNPRWPGDVYGPLGVGPRLNAIDKTGFLVKRSVFPGFPDKPSRDAPCAADGLLIERLVRAGARHAKVPDILVVHN